MTGARTLCSDKSIDSVRLGRPKHQAKYIQIKQCLMRDITTGRYPVGTYLPSESELSKIFKTSRVTVRMALDLLHKANMVDGHQGKGHYIRPIIAEQNLGRLQGFGEIMALLELYVYSKVISAEIIEANSKIAAIFDLSKGDDIVCIKRVRIAGDVPMSVDVSYFPVDIGVQLMSLDLVYTDVFTLLDTVVEQGDIGFADITMDLIYPDDDILQYLNMRERERVIRVERLTHNNAGRPIDFEYLYGHPETYRFKLRVPRW